MFTGIVEEIGRIKMINQFRNGLKIEIVATKIIEDMKVNDSVSVNGVCLTAVKISDKSFTADAVGETIRKTTLKTLTINEEVNLERAIRLSDRLGGHLVQGHINGIGTIKQLYQTDNNYFLEIDVPTQLEKYLVPEGSIAIDGISLTTASLTGTKIQISIIPHTWDNTIIKNKKAGNNVNIETDIISKYLEKLLLNKNDDNKFSKNWFKTLGY